MLYRREARNAVLTQTIKNVLGGSFVQTQSSSPSHTQRDRVDGYGDDDDDDEGGRCEYGNQPSTTTDPLSNMPKIYLYSHQKENFKAKMWSQLRERVRQDHNATYTFSQDFVSQTVCPIDLVELAKQEKEANEKKKMTKKGFQYPKPKTRKELIEHPQRPSEARCEDLKEPFMDVTDKRVANQAQTGKHTYYVYHTPTLYLPLNHIHIHTQRKSNNNVNEKKNSMLKPNPFPSLAHCTPPCTHMTSYSSMWVTEKNYLGVVWCMGVMDILTRSFLRVYI